MERFEGELRGVDITEKSSFLRLLACENDGRDYAGKSDFARILEVLKARAF